MSKGEGEKLTRDYFRLVEEILDARGLSGREVSRRSGHFEAFFSRVRNRGDLSKSWEVVEEGLGLSPRTLFAVVADEIEYDQLLAAFGPQDEPQEAELLATLEKLEELVAGTEDTEVGDEVWALLEDMERRRFKDLPAVESDARRIVLESVERDELAKNQATLAVGALGIWCTAKRHANDRGSATKGLELAIRASSDLGVTKLSARLLQRACYLLFDAEQYRIGEMLADQASRLYADIRDVEGMGTALIDSGFASFGNRHLARAESRVLLGAELLGSNPLYHVSKASAFQLAAKARSIAGDLRRSSFFLEQAAKYAASSDQHWAAIRWCAGNILFQRARFEEAEAAYREALRIYVREERITDIVMILLDWATVLVADGRQSEVSELASHLAPYLERLPESDEVRNYVEEAHACLVRARHLQALERFKEEYEKAWRTRFATP